MTVPADILLEQIGGIATVNSKQRKLYRKMLAKENAKWPDIPKEIPKDQWPDMPSTAKRIAVWRSKYWLIQAFHENGFIRLSVNRTTMAPDGTWDEDISWDDLQWVKEKVGFANQWATEIFPPADKVINVANMRHLWILNKPPEYGWNQ